MCSSPNSADMQSQRSLPRSQRTGQQFFARCKRRGKSFDKAKLLIYRWQTPLLQCHGEWKKKPLRNRSVMTKKYLLISWLILFPFYGSGSGSGQNDSSHIRVDVVLVQLNVAVTDGKGNYISGLGPEDFSVIE